jgi:hypothetical protein
VDNLSEEVRKGLREKAEQRLQTVDRERARLQQARPVASVKAAKMLGLAKQAENLYKSQVPTEQRRMLELVLSNCTFDRRSVCPTYAKPFDLIVKGQKHEFAVWDEFSQLGTHHTTRGSSIICPCLQEATLAREPLLQRNSNWNLFLTRILGG